MTARPWDPEESAWARDCYHAGDTFEEIAEASGRRVDDVQQLLDAAPRLTTREREILSLYTAGVQLEAITAELGLNTRNPKKAPAAAITVIRRKGIPVPHRIRVPNAILAGGC